MAAAVFRGLRVKAYAGHVPTSVGEKALLAADAAARALANPRRADLVGVLGETTGARALARMRERMRADAVGRTILEQRPRIRAETLRLETLDTLPGGSFGAAYAGFLRRHGFHPDERSEVRFVDDEELAYVMTRYRETHDLWHVLFALPPSLVGEVALKCIEAVQTGLPMCAAGAVMGVARLDRDRARQLASVAPWALRAGAACADLMCVRYEDHFAEDLQQLRQRLRIQPCALLGEP